MNLIEQFFNFITICLDIIFSIQFLILLFVVILIIHLILYFSRDQKYVKNIKKLKVNHISLEDLEEKPLVSVIIPAWKEKENLRKILTALRDINYPKIKIIVNGGGNKETIDICESFRKYDNFIILKQKEGEGKIKAINDSLKFVNEGLIFLTDADIFFTDQTFLYKIYHLVNCKKDVVVSTLRPHKSLMNSDSVKYLYINRMIEFRFNESLSKNIGPSTGFKYHVIEVIKEFPTKKLADDNAVIGSFLIENGFKIHTLLENGIASFQFSPILKDEISQLARWSQNWLMTLYKRRKIFQLIKFLIMLILAIYLFLFPFLIVFNNYLFFLGILILFNQYLMRIRKCVFYNKIMKNEEFYVKLSLKFYLKLVFYIYLEACVKILVAFELLFYRKKYKERKNIDI